MKIFVSGCSAGIGYALTELLLSDGHEVWGICRNIDPLAKLKSIFPDTFHCSACDTQSEIEVARVFQEFQRQHFVPDLSILNAGIYEVDIDPQISVKNIRSTFDTNFFGSIYWVDRLLPLYIKRGAGQFIAISSLVSFQPDHLSASYPGSKAALALAFRSLQLQHGNNHIKFKVIHFGPVDTLVLPRYANSKKKLWVLSPQQAAKYVTTCIDRNTESFHYPKVLKTIFWVISKLPDWVYFRITKNFRR